MKIIHLISSMDRGGAENHLYSLIKMQNRNNDVLVIYFKGNNYWKKKNKDRNIKLVRLNLKTKFIFFQLFETIFKTHKIINKFQPQVVHSHLTMMELVGSILKLFYQNKFNFFVTKHLDSSFFEGSKGKKNFLFTGIAIDKFIIKTAQKTICISKQVRNYFLKKTQLSKQKFSLIYYGFDFENFKRNKKFKNTKEFKILKKIDKKNLKLCCIARHVKQKSLDYLLHSFSEYLKQNEKCNLILVGNGPETDKLKKLSRDLNIYNKIVWIKFSENIRDILDFTDIFLLTSEYEGLGLVLLEAMASNIPIIATNTSAIPEVIINNYNGFLVKHLDKKDLIKKIKLIQKKKLKVKFCNNSRKLLNQKFNLEKMFKKTEKLYASKN